MDRREERSQKWKTRMKGKGAGKEKREDIYFMMPLPLRELPVAIGEILHRYVQRDECSSPSKIINFMPALASYSRNNAVPPQAARARSLPLQLASINSLHAWA